MPYIFTKWRIKRSLAEDVRHSVFKTRENTTTREYLDADETMNSPLNSLVGLDFEGPVTQDGPVAGA